MNYNIIIMMIAILLSIVYLFKYRNKTSIVIVLLQAIAVIAAFSKNILGLFSTFFSVTVTVFFFAALIVACFYPIIYKNDYSAPKKRYILWLFLFPIIIKFIHAFAHWPGANQMALSMLVPVSLFIYILIDRKNWKYEIGFMITFFADALLSLVWLALFF